MLIDRLASETRGYLITPLSAIKRSDNDIVPLLDYSTIRANSASGSVNKNVILTRFVSFDVLMVVVLCDEPLSVMLMPIF